MTGRSGTPADFPHLQQPHTCSMRKFILVTSDVHFYINTPLLKIRSLLSQQIKPDFIFRFDNGWIIKIGRGLDYFKRPKVRLRIIYLLVFICKYGVAKVNEIFLSFVSQGRFSVGYCDYDLRQCQETTVDIFHTKHTKTL